MGPLCGAGLESLGSRACHPGWSQLVCPQCRLVMDESTGGNDSEWRCVVAGGRGGLGLEMKRLERAGWVWGGDGLDGMEWK